jgi:hypothetical protein
LDPQSDCIQELQVFNRLARVIAHDFNNLLVSIMGHCELLADSLEPSSEQAEDIAQIRAASERAAVLSQRLLTFGRHQTPKPKRLDLREVLAELKHPLQRMLGDDVTVRIEVTCHPANVVVDRGQLEEVIYYLAEMSGRSATRNGTLTLATGATPVDGGQWPKQTDPDKGDRVAISIRLDESTADAEFSPPKHPPPLSADTASPPDDPLWVAARDVAQRNGWQLTAPQLTPRGIKATVMIPRASQAARAELAPR